MTAIKNIVAQEKKEQEERERQQRIKDGEVAKGESAAEVCHVRAWLRAHEMNS